MPLPTIGASVQYYYRQFNVDLGLHELRVFPGTITAVHGTAEQAIALDVDFSADVLDSGIVRAQSYACQATTDPPESGTWTW